MEVNTYEDALYHVKRGFLIIGLTGYTGTGCSTIGDLLVIKDGPRLPGYNSIPKFDASSKDPSLTEDVRRKEIYPSNREKRIYDKLNRTWLKTDWDSFISIKISSIIFAFAVHRALFSSKKSSILDEIRDIAIEYKPALKVLRYLRGDSGTRLGEETAIKFIEAYNICNELYKTFRKKYKRNVGQLIYLMQNFGDDVRRFGLVSPTRLMKPSPANMFVLPEAIRKVIKAYRITRKASHFVIDAFRNPYEIEYFRWKYREFYLVAVLRKESDRHDALHNGGLRKDEIDNIDKRERGELFERNKDNISEWVVSQDLNECLSKADIFIENQKDGTGVYPQLKFNIIFHI